MKQFFLVFFALALVTLVVPAEASTVLRSGESVSVANDQVVETNFYAWGNSVTVSGDMAGDVVVAGGSVTINGNVNDDILALAGTVTISGEVGDDVRVAAGDVTIEGTIAGNLTVFGGRVKLLSNATIGGDVVIYGGDVILEGIIEGQVLGTVSSLRINGTINSDVNVTANILALGERSELAGNLTYVSQNDVIRAASASVSGQIIRNDPVINTNQSDAFRAIIMFTLMILFGALTAYLVARRRVLLFSREVLSQPLWRSALIGFAVLVTTPFAVSVLLASILGVLVGSIVLFLFILMLLASIVLLPVTTGAVLATLFRADMTKKFLLWVLLGAVTLIALLPLYIIGPILFLTFVLITLGTLVQYFASWLIRDSHEA